MNFSEIFKRNNRETASPSSPKPTRLRIFWVLRLFAVFVLAFVVGAYAVLSVAFANTLLKSPVRWEAEETPAKYGLKYDEISFPAAVDNLAVKGWYVSATSQSDKVIVILHGKGQNRGSYLNLGVTLAQNGYNVVLFDFRGHGETDGKNYTFGYYEQRDVAGAVSYLKQRGFTGAHIGFVGYSLGAVAGLEIFSRDDVKAMVSDSAFADLPDRLAYAMSDGLNPLLSNIFLPGVEVAASLTSGLDVNGVKPVEAVKNLNGRHILLIHGATDQLAPVGNAYQLKTAAGDAAELWVAPGAGHAKAIELYPQEYNSRVLAYFQRELK